MVSFREFTSDALNNLFDVDSRVWRTVLPLVFQPGALTRDYLTGKRERYLPPFRTYLVLSLMFFLVASIFGAGFDIMARNKPLPIDTQTLGIETNNGDDDNDFSCQEISVGNIGFLDGLNLEARVRSACEAVVADSTKLNRAFADNIPVMMFFFIPLVAILMKILYLFSRYKYVEHLVFLFHYHAFFFIILTLIVIVMEFAKAFPVLSMPATGFAVIGWVYIPTNLLIAMRRVYRQGWLLTSMKWLLLLTGYVATLLVAVISTAIYTGLTL